MKLASCAFVIEAFGPVPFPFALATYIIPSCTTTRVGNHPAGRCPVTFLALVSTLATTGATGIAATP